MKIAESYTPFQFTFFRIAFAIFIAFEVALFIPLRLTTKYYDFEYPIGIAFDIFPQLKQLLAFWHATGQGTFCFLAALAIIMGFGYFRKQFATILLFIWVLFLSPIVFSINPGVILLSWLLFLLCVLPSGEPLTIKPRKSVFYQWKMPFKYYSLTWFVALFFSLIDFIYIMVDAADILPFGLSADTNLINYRLLLNARLCADLIFILFSLFKSLRNWGWGVLFLLHVSMMLYLGFDDFSMSILFLLIFLFDAQWLKRPTSEHSKPIIFYDGNCALCDKFIQFLIDEDPDRHFFFAPLTGDTAKEKLSKNDQKSLQTIVFLDDGKAYYRSAAVLRILSEIGGFWSLSRVFFLIPRFFRDPLYDLFSQNRYTWFGQVDYCRLPLKEEKHLFRP